MNEMEEREMDSSLGDGGRRQTVQSWSGKMGCRHLYTLSILSSVCLLTASILFVSATITNHWLVGKISLPMNNTHIPLKLEVKVRMGLKETCFDIVYETILMRSLQMRSCMSVEKLDGKAKEIAKRSMKDCTNIFVCMCVALVSSGVALIFICFRFSCQSLKTRRKVLILAVILILIAGASGLTAVLIAHQKIHGRAGFMQAGISQELPKENNRSTKTPWKSDEKKPLADQEKDDATKTSWLSNENDPPTDTEQDDDTFSHLSTTLANSADQFRKGYSFALVCSGCASVFIALMLSFMEVMLSKKRSYTTYSSDLLADSFNMVDQDMEKL